MRRGGSVPDHRRLATAALRGLAAVVALVVALAVAGPVRPARAAEPATCAVGAFILAVYGFDYAANSFDADFWVWSDCRAGQADPLDTLEYVNADTVTTRIQTQDAVGGEVWSGRKVTGTFRHVWDLRSFPFDTPTLRIELESGESDVTEFRFTPDSAATGYDPGMTIPGWRVTGFRFGEGTATYPTTFGDPRLAPGSPSAFSRLTLAMDLARTELSTFFQLTAVVYAAFILCMLTYALHLDRSIALGIQLGLLGGALFATAINLGTARNALGHQNGLTLVDLIHIAVLLYIIGAAAIAIGSRVALERGRDLRQVARVNHAAGVLAVVSFVLLNLALILRAARVG